MRAVDTSAWIEWLLDSPTGAQLQTEFPPLEEMIVPTIVQLELSKWLVREVSQSAAKSVIALTENCAVVPLDTSLAVAAAEICRMYRLPTADAVIYASAREYGGDLLTCDAHFKSLPGVVYVPRLPN